MNLITSLIAKEKSNSSTSIIRMIAKMEKEYFHDCWGVESITDTMKYDYNYILIGQIEQALAGYVIFSVIDHQCEVLRIAVHHELRRQNIAMKLMEEVFNRVLEVNVKSILLEVRQSNVLAINLYERAGFIKIFTRKNYYKNPSEDGYIFEKKL